MKQILMSDFPTNEDSKSEVLRPRRVLIMTDLGEYSEKIIAYSLLVTQSIFCEYSLIYCLEKNDSETTIKEKTTLLLKDIISKYDYLANKTLKLIISKNILSKRFHNCIKSKTLIASC